MSFFKKIENERNEFIPLSNIIQEIAYLETVTPNEVAASLYRELEIPIEENLNLYYYDITDGFVKLSGQEELNVLDQIAKKWICPLPEGVSEQAKNMDDLEYPTYADYRAEWQTEKVVVVKQVDQHEWIDLCVGVKATEFLLFLKSIKGPIPPSISTLRLRSIQDIMLGYNDMTSTDDCATTVNDNNVIPKNPTVVEWSDFHGRDTALLMIAGMAVALEKTSGKYVRGGKLNKSAVAEAAKKAINDFGCGTMLTNRALTDLLKSALDQYIDKLEE